MWRCECGATIRGTKAEHCVVPGCHETFATTESGDAHRILWAGMSGGGARCLTPDEMRTREPKPLRQNKYGYWTLNKEYEDD